MIYAPKDGSPGRGWLRVWNSRDGVTPFGISHPRTGEELFHARWSDDLCVPDHVPQIGEYIFIDLDPEKAMQYAWEKVERYWQDPDYPMKAMFGTKQEAAQAMFGDFQEGQPDLVPTTELIQRRFCEAPDAALSDERKPDE
jgi:hypothetical protein